MTGRWLLSVAVSALCVSCVGPVRMDDRTGSLLASLDDYLQTAPVYEARKKDRLDALRSLAFASGDPARRYELEMERAQQLFSYSFDSTQACFKRCQALAPDQERYNRATIGLGHLYAKAGNYLEAEAVLLHQVDSATLSPALLADYYMALYDFSRDVGGNSGVVEFFDVPDLHRCRARLLELLQPDSERWRSVRMNQFLEEWRLESADSLARILLSVTSPEEHQYAIYAYEMSDIADCRGDYPARLEWLVKSAQCDIVNAVKDYASLTMVAQLILPFDVDRSFRYLRKAQEDAIFYNAKLRPWQISRFLMDVEGAYQERRQQMSRSMQIALLLLAVLAAVLLALFWMLVVRSRKLTRVSRALESRNAELAQANEALSALNKRISEEDRIKEQYIIGFLEGLSEQISIVRTEDNRIRNYLKQDKTQELLRELAISDRSEKAKEHFYQRFDRTFLALYPDFVAQFNGLLQPEARVTPPDGRLNTELRIFALIRLGVDDSKIIASMLDYSLSTIYNYKVSVKNSALGDRESFEEKVKSIGK
ncbi:MAG: hypothetical protein IKZ91_04470 [Bacteroidales bacterium]|nr:hypothetical protein [Bacteroidales bacterium]